MVHEVRGDNAGACVQNENGDAHAYGTSAWPCHDSARV
jgi:hypothetical protein